MEGLACQECAADALLPPPWILAQATGWFTFTPAAAGSDTVPCTHRAVSLIQSNKRCHVKKVSVVKDI